MEKESEFNYELITDFTTKHILHICNRWAENTHNEDHLVPRTAPWMINNFTCAVIATTKNDSQFAAAGGIVPVLNNVNQIYFENQPVYELGSIFVYPEFRKKGIGTNLIFERLKFARKNKWLPVIVTKKQTIVDISNEFGFVHCLDHPRYNSLREKIRDCTCQNRQGKSFIGERCLNCPENGGKSILVLPPEVILKMPERHNIP